MNKHLADQKGFSHVEVILVVLVVAMIGGIGYWVSSRDSSSNKSAKTQVTTSDKKKSGTVTETPAPSSSTTTSASALAAITAALDNETAVEQTNSDAYTSRATNDTAALKSLGETYNESNF